jgi:hypothetical protein
MSTELVRPMLGGGNPDQGFAWTTGDDVWTGPWSS